MNRIIHAVFVVVQETGVLILGDSGSGKSQLALELLRRGHQLVSDDAVQCYDAQAQLYGKNPLGLGQYLDVSMIGIIDVSRIYGAKACCPRHRIDLALEIGAMRPTLSEPFADYALDYLRLRADATSDLATLLECAVANRQLKQQGFDAKQQFFQQQQRAIEQSPTKESSA